MSRSITLLLSLLFSFAAFAVELRPIYEGPSQHLKRFARYVELCNRAEEIVNSALFREEMLKKEFAYTDKTSAEVLEAMLAGSELLIRDANGVWNWEVGFYYKKRTKVLGWTNASILTVWVNTAKFDYMDDEEVMANIVHEYLHKIGFDHRSAKDWKSVPYAVGYLVEEIARKKIKLPEPNSPAPTKPIEQETSTQPEKTPRRSWLNRLRSWLRVKF